MGHFIWNVHEVTVCASIGVCLTLAHAHMHLCCHGNRGHSVTNGTKWWSRQEAILARVQEEPPASLWDTIFAWSFAYWNEVSRNSIMGHQLKVPCLFLTLWTAWAMGCVIPRILTQLWTSLRLPLAIELCQRTAPRKQDRSHKSRRTLWRSTFQIAINLLKFYFVETFMFYVCVSCFLSKWLLIYFSSHCQFIYVCISNKLIGRWRWTM